jgi:hypothetical protein
MANVLAIITSIVLLVAGFVAYKNQAAYQSEIETRKTRQQELTASEARLKKAREELAATIAERTDVDAQVVALKDKESAQQGTNADFVLQIKDKTALTASNKEKLDGIRIKTDKLGDLNPLASKMRITKAELEELGVNIKTAEGKLNNLTTTNTETEAQVSAMKKKFETISNGQSLPILHTRIRSIYPTWGFVTLGTGNSGGVVPNSTLDVVRDGSTIAKLLVTAVERNSASASIIPDSIAQDVTLMVGDQVIPAQIAPKN